MLETKQLRIFKTIVECGGFTRAAQRLALSQPAVSQQVRAMEEELGVPLLVRVGRDTRPTPAGEILLRCAHQVLDRIDEVQRLLADHGNGQAGVIRLGAPEPACTYLVPPILAELRSSHPRIDVRITSGHNGPTLARLFAGEIDLGLLPLPVGADRIRVSEIGRDELVAVVSSKHPWSQQRRVTARDFEGEPLVLYDRQSLITELTLSFLLENGVFPHIAWEIEHIEAIKHMVRVGMGVAVLPAWSVRGDVAAGTLAVVRLGKSGLLRTWGLVHRDQQPAPASLRVLTKLFADGLPRLLAPE